MYTLIKGHFHVVGYSPDGDSIKFKAKNDARWRKVRTEHWEALTQRLAEDGGAVMLRLQGIDALETHYTPATLPTPKELGQQVAMQQEKPEPGSHKQPAELAELAAAELMCMLGVKRVEWRSWGKNTWISKVYVEKRGKEVCCEEKQEDKIPGYILTRDVDRKGRPIAWVFPGSASDRDGARLTPDQLLSRIEQSANYRLLKLGLVYPYFFMTLPAVLREKLAEAARQAQHDAEQQAQNGDQAKLPNLWARDKTAEGVGITSLSKVTEQYEIYPYLFRKIIKHWYRRNTEKYWEALRKNRKYSQANSRRVSLKGLFDTGNPYVFVVSENDFVKLDSVVKVKGSRLEMTRYPFDIVFLS